MKREEIKIGMDVLYIPRHAKGNKKHKDCEHGLVSSINEVTVFVRYYSNGELQGTGKSTDPETLIKLFPDPMAMIDEMAHIDRMLSHRKNEIAEDNINMLRNRRKYLHEYSQELRKEWGD